MSEPRLRPWPNHGPAWVYAELRAEDPSAAALLARLDKLCADSVAADTDVEIVGADQEMFTAISRGAELLAELLPASGAGVLPHVSMVGVIRGRHADEHLYSLSGGDPLPSTILLSPRCYGIRGAPRRRCSTRDCI